MILIRADANSSIGMGHVMRTLSIADALSTNTSFPTIISGDAPEASFAVTELVVAAYEYCNLHGLWMAKA